MSEEMIENVYSKMARVREELHAMALKKTGKNQKFSYFELGDFLPQAIDIMAKYGVFAFISHMGGDMVVMKVVNIKDGNDFFEISHKSAIATLAGQAKGNGGATIQEIGATATYMRRYIWMLLLEVTENDIVDSSPLSQGEIAVLNCENALSSFFNRNAYDDIRGQKVIIDMCNALDSQNSARLKGFFAQRMKEQGFVWSKDAGGFVSSQPPRIEETPTSAIKSVLGFAQKEFNDDCGDGN